MEEDEDDVDVDVEPDGEVDAEVDSEVESDFPVFAASALDTSADESGVISGEIFS
jgi:hypothetical protein